MADRPSYVYVTYIESSPERVWDALTDPRPDRRSTGATATSPTGTAGRRWEHRRVDGSGIADVVGTVLESDAAAPARR